MEFITKELSDYSESHTTPESALIADLNRETHLKVVSPRMLSGHLQGRFLSFISKLKQPKLIVEIGTYTGYSALCLAEGLSENGKLISIDVNEETSALAQTYVAKSGFSNQIQLIVADAKEYIATIKTPIDLVFIDADKKNYLNYYHLVIDKLAPRGIVIADNVLWSGKILDTKTNKDVDTLAIDDFNKKIAADMRVEKLMLPLRDGITLIRKK